MTRPLRAALATLALLTPLAAQAVTWQDNSLTYTTSNRFTEPANRKPVHKDILEFVHASGYSHGINLLRVKMMRSSGVDPAKNATHGATEYYVVYRHMLSLGKLFERSFAAGPISDLALTAGFDLNTKDNLFAPRKRQLVIGPTLRFKIAPPGFVDLSLLLTKEWNHCGLPPCKAPGNTEDIGFDAFPMAHLAWRIPFALGGTPLRFEGFAAHLFRRGDDYLGKHVGEETLIRTALMADVGAVLAGRPNTVFAGVGYELWRNKFGNHSIPGVDTNAPTLHLRWQF